LRPKQLAVAPRPGRALHASTQYFEKSIGIRGRLGPRQVAVTSPLGEPWKSTRQASLIARQFSAEQPACN
jgi:hypothetical protein